MKVELNPDLSTVLEARGKKIVFVHVGKCAGESIISATQGVLPADTRMFEMHVYDANKRIRQIVETDSGDIVYLVAKRNPIDRFVSAYNWDKHNLFLSGALLNTPWEEMFHRYPTVDALVSGTEAARSEEREAAKRFTRFAHMGMGQAWYTPLDVIEGLPATRTLFVDTATLRQDLLRFFNFLGYSIENPNWNPPTSKSGFKEAYENASKLFPTFLSDGNRERLKEIISADIAAYEILSAR